MKQRYAYDCRSGLRGFVLYILCKPTLTLENEPYSPVLPAYMEWNGNGLTGAVKVLTEKW
jgi:hypothetical protein